MDQTQGNSNFQQKENSTSN